MLASEHSRSHQGKKQKKPRCVAVLWVSRVLLVSISYVVCGFESIPVPKDPKKLNGKTV